MATLKLKKSPLDPSPGSARPDPQDRPGGPTGPSGPWRPPVRGGGAAKPRPTLAQAQAERAQRAAAEAQATRHADRGPRQRPFGPDQGGPRGGPGFDQRRPDAVRASERRDDPRRSFDRPPEERGFHQRPVDGASDRPAWDARSQRPDRPQWPQAPGSDSRRPQAVHDRTGSDRPPFGRPDRNEFAPRHDRGNGRGPDPGDGRAEGRHEGRGPFGHQLPRGPQSNADRPPRRDDRQPLSTRSGFDPRGSAPPREHPGYQDPRDPQDRRPLSPARPVQTRRDGEFGDQRGAERSPGPALKSIRRPIQVEGRTLQPAEGERLSKRMTALGLASRREADEWIEAGWVRVDGKMAVLGQRVTPQADIRIDPLAHKQQAQRMTVLINKPVGYVSGQAEDGYEPAVVLVKPENRWSEDASGVSWHPGHLRSLVPAGRLDIDSVGLLVLTQDGRVAKQLIGDESLVEKEYLVRVAYRGEGTLPDSALDLMRHGLELDDEPLKPAKVSWQNEDQLRIVLREGKKRQIRRMCEAVGLQVLGLKRVRIGSVSLGHLPPGQWRYLRRDEFFI